MRLTKEQLEDIKNKYNVDRLYSWSRVNCYLTSPYEYYLQYIKHEKPLKNDSAYAPLGGVAHDLLENYYENKIKKEELSNIFDERWMENITFGDLKFNRSDDERNESIKSKYYDNLIHYFNNFIPIKYKTYLERFIAVKVDKYILQGYIDILWKDKEGYTNIGDFKTSTIYRGDDLKHKSKQLKIYALGVHQLGVPLNKIKICFNFLKYVNVEITQKSIDKATGLNKTKVRQLERLNYVEKLSSSILTWLKTIDIVGDEAKNILDKCIAENSLDNLPDQIKDKFKMNDCWVYIDFTQEDLDEVVNEISTTITKIENLEKQYNETKDENLFWDSIGNIKKQEYYLSELCGYSTLQHRPFKEYLDEKNMFKTEQNNTNTSTQDDNDLSWLEGLLD